MSKKVREFIGEKVIYSPHGGQIFSKKKEGDSHILDVRGYGEISSMFKTVDECNEFHDSVGEWIAEAINEKLKKESTSNEKLKTLDISQRKSLINTSDLKVSDKVFVEGCGNTKYLITSILVSTTGNLGYICEPIKGMGLLPTPQKREHLKLVTDGKV